MTAFASPKPDDRFLMTVLGKYQLDWRIREASVVLFEDERVLDRLAATDDSWSVRDAAARRCVQLAERHGGDAGLASLAGGAESGLVRALAAALVGDRETLARVATEDFDDRVRLAAVERLDDQQQLASVAMNDAHWEVRLSATRRLRDQHVLAEVVTFDSHAEVRYAAVQRVAGQGTLAIVAAMDDSDQVQSLAAIRLALARLPRKFPRPCRASD